MKKMMIGLFSAALLSGGLLGVSSGAAHAVCDDYGPCVTTSTTVSAPGSVARGERARICVTVRTSGNNDPQGRVNLDVARKAGGYSFSDSKRADGRTCFTTGALNKRGKYTVDARFVGKDSRNSSASDTFKVTRR